METWKLTQPLLATLADGVPLLVKTVDVFLPEAEIEIEIHGIDYEMHRIPFFWLYKNQQGKHSKLVVQVNQDSAKRRPCI